MLELLVVLQRGHRVLRVSGRVLGKPNLVEGEQLLPVEGLSLVQRHEVDILGSLGGVGEGTLDSVEVVRSDRNERALATDVVVKLVLVIDEAVVALLIEGHIAEDCAHHYGSDLLCLDRE